MRFPTPFLRSGQWLRLRALIVKELLAVLRDPRGRRMLIVPPIIQLVVLSYAATLEVTNIDVGLLNHDSGRWSVEVAQQIGGSRAFRSITPIGSNAEIRDVIDQRKAIAVIQFDPAFSRDVEAGRPAPMQIILDGRRSNASQIVLGYLSSIAARAGPGASAAPGATDALVTRHWFNPALDFQWFVVPALIGTISLMMSLVVTSQSIARERELGSFDQLMVSPLRTHEILLGKAAPPLLIGHVHATVFVLVAVFFFGVPLRGSLLLLYVGLFFFIAAVIGVGLFISALSQTQQQAVLGSFLFVAPAILLSGFATPIENMPEWLQTITMVNPLRHFLVIVRGVFLKALPADEAVTSIIPLALIALFTLTAAAWLFRARME